MLNYFGVTPSFVTLLYLGYITSTARIKQLSDDILWSLSLLVYTEPYEGRKWILFIFISPPVDSENAQYMYANFF